MFYSKFYISLVEPVEPIFGNCLENILDLEDSKVPTFLKKCVSRIEANDKALKTEGVYR